MTRHFLLQGLKELCIDATKNFELPTSVQKGDASQEVRAPEVYKMRLPKSSAAKKRAPYIIIQFVNGRDKQTHGKWSDATSLVRFIFCVYSEDEQEGSLQLLNVMDAVRIRLLKTCIVENCFKLDTNAGLESLVYPDDTAPYFAGEMIATFFSPPIEREVPLNG